ncbi:hypothetical protein BAMTA208_03790 [Bacillus amyloliquefaciens TA208]|nr:hypothetical protein BAMTA208_03790 [Bacillus amyloliquefaciens TA208]
MMPISESWALQVIVGLGVPQMRERVEKILNG